MNMCKSPDAVETLTKGVTAINTQQIVLTAPSRTQTSIQNNESRLVCQI